MSPEPRETPALHILQPLPLTPQHLMFQPSLMLQPLQSIMSLRLLMLQLFQFIMSQLPTLHQFQHTMSQHQLMFQQHLFQPIMSQHLLTMLQLQLTTSQSPIMRNTMSMV